MQCYDRTRAIFRKWSLEILGDLINFLFRDLDQDELPMQGPQPGRNYTGLLHNSYADKLMHKSVETTWSSLKIQVAIAPFLQVHVPRPSVTPEPSPLFDSRIGAKELNLHLMNLLPLRPDSLCHAPNVNTISGISHQAVHSRGEGCMGKGCHEDD